MKMSFSERLMIPESVRIPYFGGVLYRALSRYARKQVRKINIADLSLNKVPRDTTLTFTLTSFPARIDTVQYTLRTLFTQSMKPDRVVLWLSAEEFEGMELPDSIKEFQKVGLEVRFCENLLGHKRYYKLIEEQKDNELIVMFDDDILFPKRLVERLYSTWKKFPNSVVSERGQLLAFDDNKIINPGRWSPISKVGLKKPSYRLLSGPGGGCLLPPGALYKDACDPEIIKKLALRADDLWLMFMTVQNDVGVVRTHRYHRTFIVYDTNQAVQLGKEAIYQGHYEKSLADLSEAYPHAFDNMLSEKD